MDHGKKQRLDEMVVAIRRKHGEEAPGLLGATRTISAIVGDGSGDVYRCPDGLPRDALYAGLPDDGSVVV